MRKLEGEFDRAGYRLGRDSNAKDVHYSLKNKFTKRITQMSIGEIELVHSEPVFKQHLVQVLLTKGGRITTVAYPGPNVCVTKAGTAGPGALSFHGLWEAPMPGQQVLVGFVDGNAYNPIVLQKYPYNASLDPSRAAAFDTPMTKLNHGPQDVGLGSFTGSYMMIRGTTPLPGDIETYCMSNYTIDCQMKVDVKAKTQISMQAQTTFDIEGMTNVTVKAGTKIELKDNTAGTTKVVIDAAAGKIDIEAATGNVSIKSISGMVELGKAPSQFANNFPSCLFTGANHSTCTDVRV